MNSGQMRFERPKQLDEALALLASQSWDILAGGTDFYPALGENTPKSPILDITAIEGLRTIECDDSGWKIGALATWSDILSADLPPAFDGLKLAAREVGSVQIQNRATVVGNLCNASPAADGVPPLLTLDAEVELSSIRRTRRLPLGDFISGNRATRIEPPELVTALYIPNTSTDGRSHFLKLGARKFLVISIAMVAVRLVTGSDGKIATAAISVGACSEIAKRLPKVEAALVGLPLNEAVASLRDDKGFRLSPINDVRATAEYRLDASLELVRRTLSACIAQGDGHER